MADKYVQLIPARGQGGKVEWTMIYENGWGGAGSYPKINLGKDPTKFAFTIVDTNKLGITFDPQPIPNTNPAIPNALWIVTGEKAQKKQGIDSGQISGVMLDKGNTELTFSDKNDNYDTLTYQLNFVNPQDPREKVTEIDPEIKNNGGGGIAQQASAYTEVLLITGAVLLALVAYVVGRAAGKRAASRTNESPMRST